MRPLVGVVIGLGLVGAGSTGTSGLALSLMLVGWILLGWQCLRLGRGVSRWFGALVSVCAMGAAVTLLTASITPRITAMVLVVAACLVLTGARDAVGREHAWFARLGLLRWLLLAAGAAGLIGGDVVPSAETALALTALPVGLIAAIGALALLLGLRDHPALQAAASHPDDESGADRA
jgi:hypothetical protein